MRRANLVLCLLLTLHILGPRALAAEAKEPVRAWFEDVVIPTYISYPDDINPRFYELENVLIYPYTMQDNLSTVKEERTYRAAFLENEYLRVMCLPEIGGRIQSVYDKRRGEEMFYRNQVIKPGLIALRGAWISGGIEWNRGPTGHTVTSYSPVDVVTVDNPDGSASLVISNMEMNFRTVWTVRLTLHPGRAYLDEHISIANPTDGTHSYYFWNNTAFPNREGTRFIYPMTLGTDHEGDNFFTWPIHDGRDLTWLKNYPDPTSIFAYDCEFDFFGAYDVARDYGIIQVANHHVTPGKKAWTWGNSDSGLASQSVLTDEDGPYIEVQSGPLPTQADYGMLSPGQEVAWQEWWCPVFGLGQGFEYATKDIAVERIAQDRDVELRILSTAVYPQTHIEVSGGDGVSFSKPYDLTPERPVTIRLEGLEDTSFLLTIKDTDGKELVSYESPLDIPKAEIPEQYVIDERATLPVEETYLQGSKFDRQMNRPMAREWYQRALARDDGHSGAHFSLAVLDVEAGLYSSAAEHLERVLARDPRHGLAWYFMGVVKLRSGQVADAIHMGYQATRLQGTAALGYSLVGRAKMRQGDREGALNAFRAGYHEGGTDRLRLFEQMLVALYASGRRDLAERLAKDTIEKGTTRLVPRAVLALMDEHAMDPFAEETRRFIGEDEFNFLELALFFGELGLPADAVRLLSATLCDGVPESSKRPLPHYFLAYYESLLGHDLEAKRALNRAASLERDYVFPSRPETIKVLEFALENNPDDGRAHLYLGNLYAGLGRIDEAVSQWKAAVEKNESLSVAHRNLGLYYWNHGEDLSVAADFYRKAIAARPSDQILYRDLARIKAEQDHLSEALDLLETVPTQNRRRADVTSLLARTYIKAKQFSKAIQLLDSTTFSNWEGDRDAWNLFSTAHIERGIISLDSGNSEAALRDFEQALTYPENLHVGRPSKPQEARALFWKGKALAALGRAEEARRTWQEGAENQPGEREQNEHIRRCRKQLESN
jgi:tetratricopeptide (TPR) repeat protein